MCQGDFDAASGRAHNSAMSDEAGRLAALRSLRIVDTPREPFFDDIALVAAALCETPVALITMIDGTRQWYKASVGTSMTETPRDVAFCAHAIVSGESVFEVPDAQKDDRFAHNPYVERDPFVRFYAGAPLILSSGHAVGTVCALDHTPRTLTNRQRDALVALARIVTRELDRRLIAGDS